MAQSHTRQRVARPRKVRPGRTVLADASAVVPVRERTLQRTVAAYLALCRDLGLGLEFHHSPNENAAENDWINGDIETREGTQAGWPDFEVMLRGHTLFIELKTKDGPLSKKQRAVRARLEALGYPYYELAAANTMVLLLEVRRILSLNGMVRLPYPSA